MSFRRALLLVLPWLSLASPALWAQQTQPATNPTRTWTLTGPNSWTPATQPSPTTQHVDNPLLDRADRLLARRNPDAAHDLVLHWLNRHRSAPDRDRGLFLLAESYYRKGDLMRSFYQLEELLDLHADSKLFYPALEKQYEIADRYLRGYKNRFLWMPIIGGEDEAIDMLFRIQERVPGSPMAERALLRTADYYYHKGQYDLAADAYAFYARAFPRSPVIPRVKLRQAFAALAQFRGRYYDMTPLIDARAQLEGVQAAFPEMAEQEGIAPIVKRIDASMADKLYWTGNFYRRTNDFRGAAYMFRYLISRYPDSPEAARAQQRLDQLPKWALNDPPPAPPSEKDEQIVIEPPPR